MQVDYFSLLPNVRVDKSAFAKLEAYFMSHPFEMGFKSGFDAFINALFMGQAPDYEYHSDDVGDYRYKPHIAGFSHSQSDPEQHISDRLMSVAKQHREVRACLMRIPYGAQATIQSIFEPQRFDTETTERLDGRFDVTQGPIDRRLGRFAFVAMNTELAHHWKAANRTDSALPFIRDVCTKGRKAQLHELLAQVEATVQAAFDLFESEWRQRKGKRHVVA